MTNNTGEGKTNKTDDSEAEEKEPIFVRTRIRPYKTKFSIDKVVSQFDNRVLFTQYESFDLTAAPFSNPDLSAFIKVGIVDLMEDYRLMGGFRFPLGLQGLEYFIEFKDLSKRLDKSYLIYRKSENNSYVVSSDQLDRLLEVKAKNIVNYAQLSLSYPFDVYRSVRWHNGLRQDKIVFSATDTITLRVPNFYQNYLFSKVEYVFDNTIDVALNILNGSRYKFYVEVHKPFEGTINDREFSFKFKNTGVLGIAGADIRHYQRVHRQIVWANRFATGFSFGSRKMLYYLGGVENWISSDVNKRFNFEPAPDPEVGYAFKSLATNMRGFPQNIRHGTSYFVINSELRIPVFAYLANQPIRSEFFRNFQIVAFADIGSAWKGLSPFTEENQYAIINAGQPPISTRVKYYRNPFVAGYGVGLRSKIIGYFLKADVAWGLDSGAITGPVWYFSLGLDF